jgi:hypothetical protein
VKEIVKEIVNIFVNGKVKIIMIEIRMDRTGIIDILNLHNALKECEYYIREVSMEYNSFRIIIDRNSMERVDIVEVAQILERFI